MSELVSESNREIGFIIRDGSEIKEKPISI